MARIHNRAFDFGKRILVFAIAVLVDTTASGQITNWSNGNGDNLWPVAANWDSTVPTTSSIARIDIRGPLGSAFIGFHDESTNIGNVGTLIITSPADDVSRIYTRLIAGSPVTLDHFASTINLGNSAAIILNRSDISLLSDFTMGTKGLLTLTNPGSLTLSVAGDQQLLMESKIIGAGSVHVQQISGTSGTSLVQMNAESAFTGGLKLDSGILQLTIGSNPASGGSIGTGTLTMNGGFLETVESTITLANAFVLTANSAFKCGTQLELTGTVTFGAPWTPGDQLAGGGRRSSVRRADELVRRPITVPAFAQGGAE
jgi:hypothetical protein